MNKGLLETYRKASSITQNEMADSIGVARISYHYMETGKMKIKVKHALRILKVLKVDIGYYPDLTEVGECEFKAIKSLLANCGVEIDKEGLF